MICILLGYVFRRVWHVIGFTFIPFMYYVFMPAIEDAIGIHPNNFGVFLYWCEILAHCTVTLTRALFCAKARAPSTLEKENSANEWIEF